MKQRKKKENICIYIPTDRQRAQTKPTTSQNITIFNERNIIRKKYTTKEGNKERKKETNKNKR